MQRLKNGFYNFNRLCWEQLVINEETINFGNECEQAGFLRLSLVNDSKNTVYFDNFEITHKPNKEKLSVLSWSEYYAFGKVTKASCPSSGSYRYGYQGEFAEKDGETDWNSFELRQYDSEIGRWLSTDPYGQYWSPYVGMGNDPSNQVDADGGWSGDGLAKISQTISQMITYFSVPQTEISVGQQSSFVMIEPWATNRGWSALDDTNFGEYIESRAKIEKDASLCIPDKPSEATPLTMNNCFQCSQLVMEAYTTYAKNNFIKINIPNIPFQGDYNSYMNKVYGMSPARIKNTLLEPIKGTLQVGNIYVNTTATHTSLVVEIHKQGVKMLNAFGLPDGTGYNVSMLEAQGTNYKKPLASFSHPRIVTGNRKNNTFYRFKRN